MSVRDHEGAGVRAASRRPGRPLRSASARLLLIGLLALPACNGGGGGGGDDGGGTCLVFTPVASPADATVVAREGPGSTCDTLELELVIQQVDDVFGVSFEAFFGSGVVTYDGFSTTGTILDPPSVSLVTVLPTSVQLGVARTGSGVDVGATPQVLLRLMFSKDSPGTTPFSFSSAAVQDAGPPPGDIPGIQFFGGTLDVN